MQKIVSLLIFFVMLSTFLAAQEGIKLYQIRFFEGGGDVPEDKDRTYTERFSSNTARFVWCQLEVENLLYQVREQKHKVVWRYYNPDGTLRGQPSTDFLIKSEWRYAWVPHGWGWDQPGKWPVGTYRVELWVDDVKFGESSFEIYEAKAIVNLDESGLEFEFIKFFEGGFQAPPEEERQYKNEFSKSTSRYIFFMVGIKNLFHDIKDQKPKLVGKYYNQDGSLRATVELNPDVPSSWKHSDIWGGWGWDKPGNWPAGTYRLEVSYRNQKFGEASFTIVDGVTSIGSTIEYQKIRFFESGKEVPAQGTRQYATTFSKGTTRYVYYEVSVKNLLYNVRANPVKISARYYRADGSIFGEPILDYTLPADWEDSELWHGWGWPTPGNWDLGTYRVELWVVGKKFCESSFTVTDGTALVPTEIMAPAETIEFQKMRFFEAGKEVPDQRTYLTTFPKASTRYVYYEVTIKNLLHQIRDNPVTIRAKYFYPDGSIFGEPVLNYTVPQDWADTELWHGWGWPNSGNWLTAGRYRVELWVGSKKFGEDSFTITDGDSLPTEQIPTSSATIEFQKIQFFEGSSKPAALGQRQYLTQFSKATTRFIYYEVGVKNLWVKVKPNPVKILARYYAPDGSLMGEPELNYTLPQDWEESDLWHGWGWEIPGNWSAGAYRVELWVSGQKFAEGTFNVYGGTTKVTKPSAEFKFQKIRFFEAGSSAPDTAARVYNSRFSKNAARYVWCQVDVQNLLYQVGDHRHQVVWRYLNPDGSLRGETKADFLIKKEWATAWHQSGWGWDIQGQWPTGTYTVRVLIDGKQVGEGRFTIY